MRDSGWMRGALAMLGVAGVLAVSACGDGTTPEPSTSASATSGSSSPASESSSESAEPMEATPDHPAQNLVPPELPEEATEFTEEGFKAFIEYWLETNNYGLATGDKKPLKAISAPNCGFCQSSFDLIDLTNSGEENSWSVGGTLQAKDLTTSINGSEEETQSVLFTLHRSAASAYDEDGLIEDSRDYIPSLELPYIAYATYTGGEWLLLEAGAHE